MIAGRNEHRHAAAAQGFLQNTDGVPGWLPVKNIACQQEKIAVFPPAQVGDFSRKQFLLLPQKLTLGFRKSREGGIQMQVSGVQNFQSHSSTLSALRHSPVALSMVNSTASILVGPSAQR